MVLFDDSWMDDVRIETIQNYIMSKPELCGVGADIEMVFNIFMDYCKSGYDPNAIPEKLRPYAKIDDENAKLYVRNCSLMVLGKINNMKHIEAGIPGFAWSDSGDIKVCSECKSRNGQMYLYSDPETVWPGVKEGCRCVALPIFEQDLILNNIRDHNKTN
ncbi:minor capsid protein [Paenilisteria newyorkensis]|uniref:minor capsid protein n=1 Tax=Listeria newyorkensis TaxID=1497681 RepID=UPI000740FB66|nr:minor capsid protein [Listeria newyorkensis]